MTKRRLLIAVLTVGMTVPMFLIAQNVTPAASEVAAAPTTAPVKVPDLTPEARAAIDKLSAAYAGLKSLQTVGVVLADFDVGGQQKKMSQAFTSSFAAPAQFKNEMTDSLLVGSTGKQTYVLDLEKALYRANELPPGKFPLSSAADESTPTGPLMELLRSQNLSLALALSQDPGKQLLVGATEVKVLPPETIDGKTYDVLNVAFPAANIKVVIDPQSYLVRRVVADVRKNMLQRGAPDVKLANLTTDYTTTTVDTTFAQTAFDWSPPAGARDASKLKGEEQKPQLSASVQALIGKPAVDFNLKDLDGKDVKLSDQKGSVVLLDFWATWCPPCVATMPHMQKLSERFAPRGVKVFAVNVGEDKETVAKFMRDKKLTLPTVLDTEGSAGAVYKVDEGIPLKVIIDRAGVVRRIIGGTTIEIEADVEKTIDELSQAK